MHVMLCATLPATVHATRRVKPVTRVPVRVVIHAIMTAAIVAMMHVFRPVTTHAMMLVFQHAMVGVHLAEDTELCAA